MEKSRKIPDEGEITGKKKDRRGSGGNLAALLERLEGEEFILTVPFGKGKGNEREK